MKLTVIKTISNLFHPLLSMPWAAVLILLFSPYCLLPLWSKFLLLSEVLLFCLILPCLVIYLLSRCGVVKNGVALRDRSDRVVPLFVQFLLCVAQAMTLQNQGLPYWALFCFWGGAILTFVFFVVTFWWKISGHSAGNAALAVTSLILFYHFPNIVPSWLLIGTIVITGGVGSIRVYLERHTMAQVVVGALAGAVCMLLAYALV